MAKDTEKLIRQLSLISYLMAERRPVTAPEIRRDVEGYSAMNEDAFARRFYADRSELEALGILLSVEKPVDGSVEQETYSLPPENFHLPADRVHRRASWRRCGPRCSCSTASSPTPSRCGSRSSRSPGDAPARCELPEQRTVALGITGSAGGHDVSQRLAKIETAIFRRKTIVFDYYTMERDDLGTRRVDPYQLLFQGGQFYVVGRSHERDAIRVFRLSRIRGKVGYATKAEHDFQRPADFDPRVLREPDRLAVRRVRSAPPRSGSAAGSRGRSSATSVATARCSPPDDDGDRVFVTVVRQRAPADRLGAGPRRARADPRARPSWPPSCATRVELLIERHTGEPALAAARDPLVVCRIRTADRAEPETATATTRTPRSARSASPGW